MIQKIAISLIILLSASLLVLLRFDVPKTASVSIIESNAAEYTSEYNFRRGETIQTKSDETLMIKLGDNTIALDQNTHLELVDLTESEPLIRFKKGRIYLDVKSPLTLKTDFTGSYLTKGKSTFINLDHLHKIKIIPITESIITHLKETNETLLIPVPYQIKEAPPLWHEPAAFDRSIAKEFYNWVDAELDSNK
jgi:hypothetical protein